MQTKLIFTSPRHQAAIRWIEDHPRVWRYMVELALARVRNGQRFGMKALVERVRWEVQYEWHEDYKINNSMTAYLARELIARHPVVADYIETRKVQA